MINSFSGANRWLSNFSPVRILYRDVSYPSVENAYQASKCADPGNRILFMGCNPGEAKKLGNQVGLRLDWEDIKESVMLDLVRLKFADPEHRAKLLGTADEELIEGNYWGDRYWGVCRGVGQNKLGKILMRVRAEITDGYTGLWAGWGES